MALHPEHPGAPRAVLDPAMRWFPADEALRDTTMDNLMPPWFLRSGYFTTLSK